MIKKNHLQHKKLFVLIAFIIILIGGFFITQTTHAPTDKKAPVPTTSPLTVPTTMPTAVPNQATKPTEMTIKGDVVCLPHKETNGPQTLECAIGLKSADGNYFALDTNQASGTAPYLTTGEHIQVNGLMTPIENLSSDHWQKYNIKGIFSVKGAIQKDK